MSKEIFLNENIELSKKAKIKIFFYSIFALICGFITLIKLKIITFIEERKTKKCKY